MGNPVVHFEIGGPDGPVLRQFYSDLFGWMCRCKARRWATTA